MPQDDIQSDKDVIIIQEKSLNILSKATSIDINDEPSSKLGTDFLSFIKKAQSRLEDRRKFFVKPLQEQVKEKNDYFKQMIKPLKDAEVMLKGKLLQYSLELEKKAEQDAKEKEIKANKIAEDLKLPKVQIEPDKSDSRIRSGLGLAYTKKRWTYELVDFAKVPDKFKGLDTVKINSAIRAGERNIEGLKILQKAEVAIR